MPCEEVILDPDDFVQCPDDAGFHLIRDRVHCHDLYSCESFHQHQPLFPIDPNTPHIFSKILSGTGKISKIQGGKKREKEGKTYSTNNDVNHIPKENRHMYILHPQLRPLLPVLEAREPGVHYPDIIEIHPE